MDSIEEMRDSHIQIHEFRVDSIQISTKDITLLSFVPAQLTACRMQPHPAKRTWGGLHHSHFCWGKDDQTWEFGGIHDTWGHGDHILQASPSIRHGTMSKSPFFATDNVTLSDQITEGITRWLIKTNQFVTNQLKRPLWSLLKSLLQTCLQFIMRSRWHPSRLVSE